MRADMRTDLFTLETDLEGFEVRIHYLDGSELKGVETGRSFCCGEVLSTMMVSISNIPKVLVRSCNCPTCAPAEADERKPMLIPLGDIVGVEVSNWRDTGDYDCQGYPKDALMPTARWLRDSSGRLRRFVPS